MSTPPIQKNDNIRIMPGNPLSSNPAQQDPYVIDQKEGQFLAKSGERVKRNIGEDTHIPLNDYRFGKR
jgi:hypothetical protein